MSSPSIFPLGQQHGRWHAAAPLLCAVSLLLAAESQAVLLSQNDLVFGSGAITLDTDTGLEWLDPTLSRPFLGLSFNAVAAQFGTGGDFEGFRHATGAEVNQLFFVSAGITPGTQTPAEASLMALQALVGFTSHSSGVCPTSGTIGLFDDSGTGSTASVGKATLSTNACGTTTATILDDVAGPNSPSFFVGHWLVRATVPETALLVFLGLPGAILVSASRRPRLRDAGAS